MRVCGDEVNLFLFYEIKGHALSFFAHVAKDGISGDLNENS